LQYCIDSIEKLGVKALVFYPTKALANDQAKRLFRLLYSTNAALRSEGKRAITMALYHGDIGSQLRPEEAPWIPFKCPMDAKSTFNSNHGPKAMCCFAESAPVKSIGVLLLVPIRTRDCRIS